MTKITTTLGILVALAICFTAATAAPQVSFGVKAGATVAHMHADDWHYESSESTTGIVAGPFAEVALSQAMTFQAAVVYARRGAKFRDLPGSLTGTLGEVHQLDLRRDYLEMQTLFRYDGPWRSRLPVFLVAGPAIGWVLDYEVMEDGREIGHPQAEHDGWAPRPSAGYDLALVLGAGITHSQWGKQCTLDLVYRLASEGPRGNALGNGFVADGLNATLGLRF